ncbi:hypothetical protein [Noviherbaspirillum sedimenti]|uniref:Uncharacterized protein n=1 Tax=Noviherbaspirillum sedimenti TaxID=2320865 RepID=A0A3A3G4C9_9BURK|nr:hypothetical protein [Noviherbaspirillum sedimenti]RJG02704.1 hypothetical protein D3878_14890 [Noviherbaspirillum sedimenti]
MMKTRYPIVGQRRHRAQRSGRACTDDDDEELDEVESLPRDAEHDEDEIDPDPDRHPAPSEHAQERHSS